MPSEQRLTDRAHDWVRSSLTAGAAVVDATVGNGFDLLFLAECVGLTGQVFGLDIQPAALRQARQLAEARALRQVTLIHRGHEQLADAIPVRWHGQIAAVMFNLGYLPGSDKSVTTTASTTLAALRQSAALLQPGGVLSVLAYRGHALGEAETSAVRQWLADQSQLRFTAEESGQAGRRPSPVLFVAHRNQE